MQHLLAFVLFLFAASHCLGASVIVNVNSVATLTSAINNAQPGHIITIAPGSYTITASKLVCTVYGTATDRIQVRAATAGTVTLNWGSAGNLIEGFYVSGRYWTFENLVMVGNCASHSNCEHAWHIVGTADFTTIRNNVARNFNAQIKSNINAPLPGGGLWPDDCVVEFNEFYDSAPRNTGNPVTKVNIDGGRRWIVRGNYIHDFGKIGGVSYGTFMKSNSRNGTYEGNMVVCSLLHTGDTRIGISFGGGGTNPDTVCEDGTCSIEHQYGVMKNNIISTCSDVGIYLNEAVASKIYNNLLYATTGIDNRFAVSTADIRNNIVGGGNIRNRDSATFTTGTNWITGVAELNAVFANPAGRDFKLKSGAVTTSFVNAGAALSGVTTDYCKKTRVAPNDIGAIDYSVATCSTAVPPKV